VTGASVGERIRASAAHLAPRANLRDAGIATAIVSPLVLLSVYGWLWTGNSAPSEFTLFGPAGAALLRGRLGEVFEHAYIQGGPFELIPYGAAWMLDLRSNTQWAIYFSLAIIALLFFFLVTVLAPVHLDSRKWRIYLAIGAGAAAVLSNFLPDSFQSGHPAQVVIACLWVLAAISARNGHFVTVGVLLGIGVGWETWAILGAPVIFCAARPHLVKAAIAGAATVGVLYLPFIATGHFAMGEYIWDIEPQTIVHHLFPTATEFGWPGRLIQAALAVGIGILIARLTRLSAHTVWLVPVAIIAARFPLDPLNWFYYWCAPGVLLILGAALAASRKEVPLTIAVAAVATWLAPTAFQPWLAPRSIAGKLTFFAVVVVAIPLWVALAQRRAEAPEPATPPTRTSS
jgi:hypothetical protein